MEFSELTSLLVNNGTAIAVILYFMWRDYKFMDTLSNALSKLDATTTTLTKLLQKESED